MLRSTTFTSLTEHPDTRILIVSPFAKQEEFLEEFKGSRIEHRLLPLKKFSSAAHFLLRLREFILRVPDPLLEESLHILRGASQRRVIRNKRLREHAAAVVHLGVSPLRKPLMRVFDLLEERILIDTAELRALRDLNLAGIVLGTLGAVGNDITWLAYARRLGIPAFVIDLPWNYLENRMYAYPRAAHVCVWGPVMANRLKTKFLVPEKYIHTTGCIRYDAYKNFTPQPREAFAAEVGVDPERPLITFFLSSAVRHGHQPQVIERILEAVLDGRLPNRPQLLIRFGPSERPNAEYLRLKERYPNDLVINLHEESPEQAQVANLIYHSVASLSIFSSTALDAAVLDRPVAFVGFAGHAAPHPDDAPILRIFDLDFVRQALDTGGITLLKDTDSLILFLQDAAAYPARDHEKRHTLTKHFLGTIDGNAGLRIAEVLRTHSS